MSGLPSTIQPEKTEDKSVIDKAKQAAKKTQAARFVIQRKTEHSGKRREAAMMYCSGLQSMSTLSRYLKVSRQTLYEWKEKDRWDELARMTEEQITAEAVGSLTEFRANEIQELKQHIKNIDNMLRKNKIQPRSYEGLMKVRLEALDRMLLLHGAATERHEQVVVSVGRAAPERHEGVRGAVPANSSQTPQTGAFPNAENSGDSGGGPSGGGGRIGGLIEISGETSQLRDERLKGWQGERSEKQREESRKYREGLRRSGSEERKSYLALPLEPKKEIARKVVSQAIYYGEMDRKPCELCGEKKSHAHHPNYDRPFQVRYLCAKHHQWAHELGRMPTQDDVRLRTSVHSLDSEKNVVKIVQGVQIPRAEGKTMAERRENARKGRFRK